MEKYYYARQCDPECFDWNCYFTEEDAAFDKICIYGNNEFYGLNDYITPLEKALNDAYYDCLEVEQTKTERNNLLNYYFRKENNKALTPKERTKLLELIEKFNKTYRRFDEYDIYCEVLSIIHGEEFKYKEICGCCQRDWNYIFYPVSTKQTHIDYVEAVYFGTGTEYEITEEKISNADEMENVFTHFDYTYEYNKSKIKEWLANNIGCTPEEIKLVNIKSSHQQTIYTYEEE